MGAGRGNVVVISKSPSGMEYNSKVEERDSKYYSKVFPNEIGKNTFYPIKEDTLLFVMLLH